MKRFLTLLGILVPFAIGAAPVSLTVEQPVRVERIDSDTILFDFGKVAFGNLEVDASAESKLTFHFGEAFKNGRIDRKPPGSVRYKVAVTGLGRGKQVVAPPADMRNTEVQSASHPPAILTPTEWGVVLPFRWVEVEGWKGDAEGLKLVRRAAYSGAWDDTASAFASSDPLLNQVWDLCKYSIKATTFAGLYVDGDRERIPYEADAYLNQLSHYCTDSDVRMARGTFDHLMKHGTWPTEWAPHMVFMAYADWMHTGDLAWLAPRLDALKTKLLTERIDATGLVASEEQHIRRTDIVDWPVGERDGYVFTRYNTVVNAFHVRSVGMMAQMAAALGRDREAREHADHVEKFLPLFLEAFYDQRSRLFRDGRDSSHSSLHANLFPLAFGLVPEEQRGPVADWLISRGMRCSVYAAQYLFEGLFESGRGTQTLDLMLADHDRSWRHMVNSGTTITWEAWDQKYKPNQDWNHAWGAAPANLLPRYVLGVRPQSPGWAELLIQPQTGRLSHVSGKVPTPRGSVEVWIESGETYLLKARIPAGAMARIEIPAGAENSYLRVNGKTSDLRADNGRFVLESITGDVEIRRVSR